MGSGLCETTWGHMQVETFPRSSLFVRLKLNSVSPSPPLVTPANLPTKLFAISPRTSPIPSFEALCGQLSPRPGSTPATPNLPPKLFVVRLKCTLRSTFYRSSKPSYEALCDQPTEEPHTLLRGSVRSALFPPPEVHQLHPTFLRSSLWEAPSILSTDPPHPLVVATSAASCLSSPVCP